MTVLTLGKLIYSLYILTCHRNLQGHKSNLNMNNVCRIWIIHIYNVSHEEHFFIHCVIDQCHEGRMLIYQWADKRVLSMWKPSYSLQCPCTGYYMVEQSMDKWINTTQVFSFLFFFLFYRKTFNYHSYYCLFPVVSVSSDGPPTKTIKYIVCFIFHGCNVSYRSDSSKNVLS